MYTARLSTLARWSSGFNQQNVESGGLFSASRAPFCEQSICAMHALCAGAVYLVRNNDRRTEEALSPQSAANKQRPP